MIQSNALIPLKLAPRLCGILKHEILRWDYVLTELPGPSRVDTLYIAYGLELNIPVVTDDQDMIGLAKEFEVKVLSTLELLKIMYDCQHVDMQTIDGICDYWRYTEDLPANFIADYKRLFVVK